MNKKTKIQFLIGLFAVICAALIIAFVLSQQQAVVVHPKGVIAHSILDLIIKNILFMLIIIVPTYVLLFTVVWRYCIAHKQAKSDQNLTAGPLAELIMWGFPSLVILMMAFLTVHATYKLNPYKPIESDVKPLSVQVIALNWKWLFIYPDLGVATLNDLHLPHSTPIHFKLTADQAPMNSFWIPQLSGQIYAMTGMTTQLNLMADHPGEYVGKAVEINGEGYASMTFPVTSLSSEDFDKWVAEVKQSPKQLTNEVYEDLVKPAVNSSTVLFSEVEQDLFRRIVHSYMYPTKPVL